MPLLILCGHPCSGKTVISNQLIQYLTQTDDDQKVDICLLNHETLALSRSLYANPFLEKKLRAELKTAVERLLTEKRIVVLDYLNSIKGYRYELFCRSKEASTKHCVIYIQTSTEQCREWHEKRKSESSDNYADPHFEDLCNRMEFPNEKNRWDAPLFTIKTDSEEQKQKIFGQIRKFLISGKAHQASIATISQRTESSGFLFELDRITTICIQRLLKLQNTQQVMIGDEVAINEEFRDVKIDFIRKVTLSELKRIQNQYMSICRIRPPKTQRDIVVQFAQHLSCSLARE